MPVFRDRRLEDDQNQGPGLKLSSGSDQSALAQSGQPQGAQQKESGSNFQNLDKYLAANDAKGFGQQVGAKIQGDIDQSKKTIGDTFGEVKSQIGEAGKAPAGFEIQAAIDKPDTANAEQFQGWLNQTYQGPRSLQDNQAAASKVGGAVSNAQEKAKLAGSESGRFALLDSYFGKPSYSFGEKSLDNLLVQRGGGLDNTKRMRDESTKLGASVAEQSKQVQQLATEQANAIDQSRQFARSAIGLDESGNIQGGALGKLQSDVESRAKAANESADQLYARLFEDLADNEWTPETMEALGMKVGDSLYGLSPRDLISRGQAATAQTMATGDEYARYQALAKLAGIDPAFLSDATLAGTGGKNMVTIDADKFKQQRAVKEQEFQSTVKPWLEQRAKAMAGIDMSIKREQEAAAKLKSLDRVKNPVEYYNAEQELKGFQALRAGYEEDYQRQQSKIYAADKEFNSGGKVGRAKMAPKPIEGGVR